MNSREQFEQWAIADAATQGVVLAPLRNGDWYNETGGSYLNTAWAAWQSAKGYIPVRKMGNYGRAYDMPEDRRAYSYKDQPDNQGAYRIGLAANNLKQPCGDLIDKGLALLAELEAQGYGIFELEKPKC